METQQKKFKIHKEELNKNLEIREKNPAVEENLLSVL